MEELVHVAILTSHGEIIAEIYLREAPVTSDNFLQYVDSGLYDGGRFWRTVTMQNQPDKAVKIEVIQGGVSPENQALCVDPIKLERTTDTCLSHLDGSLSMARSTPDSAISEFFICVGDQPSLDYGGERNPDGQGFAVFGKVIQGLEVVKRIHESPCEGQQLTPVIPISSIRRTGNRTEGRAY